MKRFFIFIIIAFLVLIPLQKEISAKIATGKISAEFTGEATTGKATTQQVSLSIPVTDDNQAPVMGEFNSSIFICEASYLEYSFNASDPDQQRLTLSISPENPFFVYPQIFNGLVNIEAGIISGKIGKENLNGVNTSNKTYEETVTISDNFNATCCSDSASTNITIIEINNPIGIEQIGVQTIWTKGENSTFYKAVGYNDIEYNENFGSISFNISFQNETLFNISQEGEINFTANSSQIGNHNITVCVNDTGITNTHQNISDLCGQDGSSQTDCTNFILTITDENRAPTITNYTPENLTLTLPGTNTTSFNITKNDPDGTIPDAYWYLDDIFVQYNTGNLEDSYSYSAGCNSSGNHTIKAEITDGELNTSIQWNITIEYVGCETTDGGGGGGGGWTLGTKNFTLSKEEINLSLGQGENKVEVITIKNNEKTPLTINISNSNLQKFLTINQDSMTLAPGEEKNLLLDFKASTKEIPNLYLGKILFNAEGTRKEVFVSLEIESRNPLFDVKIKILEEYQTVYPGEEFGINATVLNLGEIGSYDIELEYIIIDENGKKILLEKEGIRVTKKETNFLKYLLIPENLKNGRYILYVRVIYEGNIGSTNVWFSSEVEPGISSETLLLIITISILIIILLIIGIKKILKTIKNMDKQKQYSFSQRPPKI